MSGRERLRAAGRGLGWMTLLMIPALPLFDIFGWPGPPAHPAVLVALIALCGTLSWRRLNRFEAT
ncbi:MAG: hypothetical protein HY608_09235 [Planctomycetes bacterium]|nr:hypothetical protein [Planctomycetota bacterium]